MAGCSCRIGMGYDIHPVTGGRELLLGGVTVDAPFGLGGHTDGDVVLHAIIDAMFGAAGLGDIGEHFSDSDPALKGASSRQLLLAARQEIQRQGWRIGNVDMTILAEKPKLLCWKGRIRASVAELLGTDPGCVSVKAKTHEGFGEIGQGRAIACQAVLLLKPQTERK